MEKISEAAYEIAIGSLQMQSKRLFILCIILIAVLVGTNGAWLYYESQFSDTVMTQEVESDGDSSVIVNGTADGDISYGGESKTDDQNKATESP